MSFNTAPRRASNGGLNRNATNRTNFGDTLLSGSPFSYLFNADNQNKSGGFAYDGSGNPTQFNNSAAGDLAYDPEQRLTGIASKGFAAHYDGDGMRDYVTAGGTTTYFLYDGASPVLEETYSGSTTTIQVANGFADGWRERYGAASLGFNAYGFDPQGSLAIEDSSFNTTLPAQNEYVYDGYGDRLVGERVSSGSTTAFNIDPVQFGGQYGYYTDLSTGEVDLTHRYYDPSTGHFLNRDPIGYNGGQNLYAFCGNNPINRQDPKGTDDDTNGWTYLSGVFDYATPHDYWIAARYNSVTRAVLTLGDLASWIPGPENPGFDYKVGKVAVEGAAHLAPEAGETLNALGNSYKVGKGQYLKAVSWVGQMLVDYVKTYKQLPKVIDAYKDSRTGGQLLGTFNPIGGQIRLYRGWNLGTLAEELYHAQQAQRYRAVGGYTFEEMGHTEADIEGEAHSTILAHGFVPK